MPEGNYEQCRICKQWGWSGSHVCPPLWTVVEVEEYQNKVLTNMYQDVYAETAKDAAALFAWKEDVESADYTFVQGGGKVAVFPKSNPGKIEFFDIQGEMVPQYTANSIEFPKAIQAVQGLYKEEMNEEGLGI